MRFKQFIDEAYITLGRGLDIPSQTTAPFPIYKNPDSTDYKELRKSDRASTTVRLTLGKAISNVELRTIIDLKNKNLYVWDALLGVHIEGFGALKRDGELKIEPDSAYNLFCGGGSLGKSNKLSGGYDALSFVEYMQYYGLGTTSGYEGTKEDIENKCGWLKKYFNCGITVLIKGFRGPVINFG